MWLNFYILCVLENAPLILFTLQQTFSTREEKNKKISVLFIIYSELHQGYSGGRKNIW